MALALEKSGIKQAQMTAYLDVHRNTVSNYLKGRTEPDTRTLRLWALRCGVPFDWLAYGVEDGPDDRGTSQSACNGDVLMFPIAA